MTTCLSAEDVYFWGVVPILPALPALLVILPLVAVSLGVAIVSLLRPRGLARLGRLAWRQRWALAVCASAGLAAWWVTAQVSGRSAAPLRPLRGGADWPMYRGNLVRSGAVAETRAPTKPELVWAHSRLDEAFYSSPAVVGERVYAVGSQGDRGRIYCFHALTGAVIWSAAPSGYRATFSSPVIADHWLVCGEGLHHARLARVVCVDLRPGREGAIAWTFQTRSHVECTPVIADGRVYFGAGDDGVYCLELEGARDGKPRMVWHVSGDQLPDAETSLAVHDQRVYVGLGLNGNAVCVLNAETGQLLGRVDVPYPVFSPPAIHDGKLYVGMGVGDYVTPQRKPEGRVYCIDLATLHVDWFFATGSTVLGAVAIDEQSLVFGCADGRVMRLNQSGQLVAECATYAPIIGSPAIARDTVYVVNSAGTLYALQADTLEIVWQQTLGTEGRFVSSPAVAHGHVYVGTEKDGLVCAGRSSNRSTAEWPGALGGAGYAGCRDDSQIPDSPTLRWTFPDARASATFITAPITPANDRLIVPVAEGDLAGLVVLRPSSQGAPVIDWKIPVPAGVTSSAAVALGRIFFVDGSAGKTPRTLHGVALNNASDHWTLPLGQHASEVLLADASSVIVRADSNTLLSVDHAGKVIWQREAGAVQQLVSGNAAVLAVANETPELMLLDRPTGKELWRVPLTGALRTSPILLHATVLVGTSNGVELRLIEDGRLQKRSELSRVGVVGPMYADPLVCVFRLQNHACITASSRDLNTIADTFLPSPASFVLLTSHTGLVYDGEAIYRFGRGESAERWFDTRELGQLTSPLILHQNHLFFATSARGLACLAEDSHP